MKIAGFFHKFFKSIHGQGTVELAIVFPVVLIVAFICINALMFISECAKYDRLYKIEISSISISPGSGQDIVAVKNKIKEKIQSQFNSGYEEVDIACSQVEGGFWLFDSEFTFYPNIFGRSIRGDIFGISLFNLKHKSKMIVDSYKPGVFF